MLSFVTMHLVKVGYGLNGLLITTKFYCKSQESLARGRRCYDVVSSKIQFIKVFKSMKMLCRSQTCPG